MTHHFSGQSLRRWLLTIGLTWTLAGCGPKGVGSVDFAPNPNATTIGAPKPKPGSGPPRRPSRPARKKAAGYIPG